MSVQAVINAAPAGTIFQFQPGTYNVSLTPRSGDVYDGGNRAAVLDGQDTLEHAFYSTDASNVTVRGFTIQHYDTPLQEGAIHSFGTTGWTIQDNHVTLNAASGITTDSGARVLNNLLDWNAQEGFAAHGSDLLYEGNEIAYNNHDLAVDATWEAGGGKFWDTVGAVIRNNNVHDNGGHGLWDDTNNIYITYDGNTVDNNWGSGIYHEIGYEATIINNTITGNGMPSSPAGGEQLGWLWDAGIQIRSCRPVNAAAPILIQNNTVTGNYNGISLIDSPASGATGGGESAYGNLYLANITVDSNTIGMTRGASGVVQDGRGSSVFTQNLVWTNNDYTVADPHAAGDVYNWFAWNDLFHDFATWQGFGHDATGSCISGGQSPPTTPPTGTRFSTGEDLALLDGPSSAPGGAVTVNPGTDLNTVTQANAAGTTFYLTAGTHTFDTVGQFSQVIPKAGNTYVGAPGAKLDGQSVAQYAFTGSASGVTIKYLEVMNFVCPFDEFVVNHNAGDNWTIQYCQVHHCGGAGIGMGSGSSISYCWLHHNRQYAFSTYKDPVADGATPAITSVTIDHCELSHCGDALDEYGPDGTATFRGRNGNCKFWDTSGITFTNSWMHHSVGTGLWADTNNIGALVEGNLFEDNSAVAFFYEISYNFRVRYNTFRRNALVEGVRNNTLGDSFPRAAIYISESGGDSRVTATYAASTIASNAFVNNWDDIALWESADRFCNSPANTSSKIYKPLGGTADLAVCNNPSGKTLTVTLTSGSPNFTVTGGTFESTDEGRPVSGTGIPGGTKIVEPRTSNGFASGYLGSTGVMTANATTSGSVTMTVAAGSINTEPSFTDCRWHTQNITVSGNTFDHNRSEVLGAHNTANANPLITSGRQAVFSQYGTYPAWSPYQATTIQDLIVTQNNVWQNNTYRGDYRFLAKDTSNQFNFATWQASPYNQDSGSTYDATPPTGGGGGTVYLPDPPTGVTATAGNAQARVAFTPPVDDGGATLVGYTVTASPGGATATATSGPIVVTGLTNTTAYTFTVTARTNLTAGTASSASGSVTPTSGASAFGNSAPWQPQKVSALRKTGTTAYVGFLAPVSTGGAAITGYTASATPVGGGSAITAGGSASPLTITGLNGATSYTYTVTATNSVGTGPASQPV